MTDGEAAAITVPDLESGSAHELEGLLKKHAGKSARAHVARSARDPSEPRAAQPWDGHFRVYLYLFEGAVEEKLAHAYLEEREKETSHLYARDAVINGKKVKQARWTSELRLDKMREHWIIIPLVRDVNRDRSESIEIANRFRTVEHRSPIVECVPIEVGEYLKAAESDDGDDDLRQSALVNRVGEVCAPAAPRIQRRGDGRGNHVNWLTLRWG